MGRDLWQFSSPKGSKRRKKANRDVALSRKSYCGMVFPGSSKWVSFTEIQNLRVIKKTTLVFPKYLNGFTEEENTARVS